MLTEVDEQKVAIEAIANLANIKSDMVRLILKPAGVPPEVYLPLLKQVDDLTGKPLTKRAIAPLVLQGLDRHSCGADAIRKIIEIAANWTNFALAWSERDARGTVEMAKQLLGTIQRTELHDSLRREQEHREELERTERERQRSFGAQLNLLLCEFDDMAKADDHQRRGYYLQDLLSRVFDLFDMPVQKSFTRNEGAEQIDGAFKLEGWHYLVECRWRERLADIRQLDGLKGQIDRSGPQIMGVFLSIYGWSENVPTMLMQNPDKRIILMNGDDLRCVLDGQANLRELLSAKLAALNLRSQPFFSVRTFLQSRK